MRLTDSVRLFAGWTKVASGEGGDGTDEADDAVIAEDMPCGVMIYEHLRYGYNHQASLTTREGSGVLECV